MSYTPVELRHVRVGRRPFGYHRASVEQVLSNVADSFETVWRDRGELADKVEQLEQELEELKRREQVLTNTLVAAEHAAEEMRVRAKREAELIVAEAHAEARSVTYSGQSERERLLAEARRIEALLRSALGIVAEASDAAEGSVAQPAVVPPPVQPEVKPDVKPEDTRDPRPVAAAPAEELPETPAAPAAPQAVAEQPPVAAEDDTPGWPPLRKVAQGGADFDWGD